MKRPLAFVMGVTGDMAFAVATVAQSLYRHNSELDYDLLVMTANMPAEDQHLLSALPRCQLVPFEPERGVLGEAALQLFSVFALSKFEIFRLLNQYKTVVWLDGDVAVQDSLRDLVTFGPLALAKEDPHFSGDGEPSPVAIDFTLPVPGYDMQAPHYNSGVIVAQDSLPEPEILYAWCLGCARDQGPNLTYADQGVFNLLAQRFAYLVCELPWDRFNAHPRNPASLTAPLVHAFGAYKLWNDGISSCSFPEWRRDYQRWVALGGTPFCGTVENSEFLDGGPFFILTRLFENLEAADEQLAQLAVTLNEEQRLRRRFEKILHMSTQTGK